MENKNKMYVSNFFTYKDVMVANPETAEYNYPLHGSIWSSIRYTAARMDTIKFILNTDLEIVNWYMTPEVIKKTGTFERTPHGRGLAVEFKTKDSKYTYEVLKNKILQKNTIKLSVHELIYNVRKDTVYISFKNNIEIEKNKIGIMKGTERFYWSYVEGKKVVPFTNKKGVSANVRRNYK